MQNNREQAKLGAKDKVLARQIAGAKTKSMRKIKLCQQNKRSEHQKNDIKTTKKSEHIV